jgi:hypothetical protein
MTSPWRFPRRMTPAGPDACSRRGSKKAIPAPERRPEPASARLKSPRGRRRHRPEPASARLKSPRGCRRRRPTRGCPARPFSPPPPPAPLETFWIPTRRAAGAPPARPGRAPPARPGRAPGLGHAHSGDSAISAPGPLFLPKPSYPARAAPCTRRHSRARAPRPLLSRLRLATLTPPCSARRAHGSVARPPGGLLPRAPPPTVVPCSRCPLPRACWACCPLQPRSPLYTLPCLLCCFQPRGGRAGPAHARTRRGRAGRGPASCRPCTGAAALWLRPPAQLPSPQTTRRLQQRPLPARRCARRGAARPQCANPVTAPVSKHRGLTAAGRWGLCARRSGGRRAHVLPSLGLGRAVGRLQGPGRLPLVARGLVVHIGGHGLDLLLAWGMGSKGDGCSGTR